MFAAIKIGAVATALVGSVAAAPVVGAVTPDAPAAAQIQAEEQQEEHRPNRVRHQGVLFDTILETLGVSRGDVVSHLRTGGTLAELAEENGSSADELIAALVAVVQERVDEALAIDAIDEERAEEIIAKATERFTELVIRAHDGNPGLHGRGKQFVLNTTMEFLDLNQGQVVSHVRTGGTLAELAEENGSSGPELEAALVDAFDAMLQEAVANEQITGEQAAQMLERATEKINEVVYKVHTPGNGHGNAQGNGRGA